MNAEIGKINALLAQAPVAIGCLDDEWKQLFAEAHLNSWPANKIMNAEQTSNSIPADHKKRPSRLRLYLVPEDVVLALFNYNWAEAQFLRIPQCISIPVDSVVHGVHVDYASRAFAFKVGHESFDEIKDCCELPVFRLSHHDFQIKIVPFLNGPL